MPSEEQQKDLALCLSGGGFRATFFHLGVVSYMRASSLLNRVSLICSVSGGSVLAGHLSCNWERYSGDERSFREVARELVAFAQGDLRGHIIRRVPLGTFFPRFRRTALLKRYFADLVKGATLGQVAPSTTDAPGRPTFHFLSTSMTSGNLCFFSSDGFAIDHGTQLRLFPRSTLALGTAIAASSAFPPLFPPLKISRDELGASVEEFPYECEYLTDGGVFDNNGIRHVYRRAADFPSVGTVVSSDASGAFDWDTAATFSIVVPRTIRATDILMKRVADLEDEHVRLLDSEQSFRVVAVDIADAVDARATRGALDPGIQRALKNLRTDFDRFNQDEIECLVNHGYVAAQKSLAHLVGSQTHEPAGSLFDGNRGATPQATLATIENGRFRRWHLWNSRDPIAWANALAAIVVLVLPPLLYAMVVGRRADRIIHQAEQTTVANQQALKLVSAQLSEQSGPFAGYFPSRIWKYASSRVVVAGTGVSATQNDPPCGDAQAVVSAAQVVDRVGASELDQYLRTASLASLGSSGITSELATSEAGREWIGTHLGAGVPTGQGLAACATQCIIYPRTEAERLSIWGCLSELNGDGLDCGGSGWNQGQWMGAFNLSHATTTLATVSCMTGKNWSHDRTRLFWVIATDGVNPLSGVALTSVYR